MGDSERYRKGVEVLKRVGGLDYDVPLKALEDTAPDLVRWAVAFGYGDIMSRPALDLPTRQLATVAALSVMGNAAPQLRYHIDGALNVGCPPAHVTEAILLAAFHVESAAAAQGLQIAQEAFESRRIRHSIDAAALNDPARYAGELGPRLDARTRALATIALLTALGTAPDRLKSQIGTALDSGASHIEIVEVIQQMALYAGFPAALNGIAHAKEAFAMKSAPR